MIVTQEPTPSEDPVEALKKNSIVSFVYLKIFSWIYPVSLLDKRAATATRCADIHD